MKEFKLNPNAKTFSMGDIPKKSKSKKSKSKKPSAYNLFMSKELKKLKAEHPNKSHAERFKMAASNWKK